MNELKDTEAGEPGPLSLNIDLGDIDAKSVKLDSLDAEQLSHIKKQIDDETEHLTTSFNQLHAAQSKFRECLSAIGNGLAADEPVNRPILVPLTNSLYCRGRLSNPSRVLIDIGTGFHIEKEIASGARFYHMKIDHLAGKMKDLDAVLQQKTSNARILENALHKKLQVPALVTRT